MTRIERKKKETERQEVHQVPNNSARRTGGVLLRRTGELEETASSNLVLEESQSTETERNLQRTEYELEMRDDQQRQVLQRNDRDMIRQKK